MLMLLACYEMMIWAFGQITKSQAVVNVDVVGLLSNDDLGLWIDHQKLVVLNIDVVGLLSNDDLGLWIDHQKLGSCKC